MTAWHSLAFVVLVSLVTAAPVRGEPGDSGPSFFGLGRDSAPSEPPADDEKRGGFSWFGGTARPESPPARGPDEPSGWDKFSDGTRRFFSNPFGMFTPRSESQQLRGSEWRSGRPDYVRKKPPSEPSWFSSLFKPKPQRPQTVNEFLSQPRVGQ